MATSHHGRDQIDYVKMGVKRDGTITGIHINVIADLGAYYLLLTPFIPSFGGVRGERLLQDPARPDGHHRRLHEQVPDGRDPRRRAARGDAPASR